MLLAGLSVAARVDERIEHHRDVTNRRLNLFDNKRFGMWKFFVDFFGHFASSYLCFLKSENSDAHRSKDQVLGFRLQTIKVNVFICHNSPL